MTEREKWTVDDSGFRSYVELVGFRSGKALDCIIRRIGKDSLNAALDLAGGSNGRAVRDMIDMGIVGRGVFTNLVDARTNPNDDDDVHFVQGDLRTSLTWESLLVMQERIAPSGFSLITHRPYGALQELSADQYIAGAARAIAMLKAGGMLYCQIPTTYAYDRNDKAMISQIGESIGALDSVECIERSVSADTLAEHDFCIIYKHS